MRILLTITASALMGLTCSCQSLRCDDLAEEQQSVVGAMWNLVQQHQDIPAHLRCENPQKIGKEFDVARYFGVLKHISMREGYALDYVYYYTTNAGMFTCVGSPRLYARKNASSPFATYRDLERQHQHSGWLACLDYIDTDGSAEGFMELQILSKVGSMFCNPDFDLNGMDPPIICSRRFLRQFLSNSKNFVPADVKAPQLIEVLRQAKDIDPTPRVSFKSNTVTVEMVMFSNYVGFFRERWTLTRHSPHKSVKSERTILVPYDCGIII